MRKMIVAILSGIFLLTGCATPPKDIEAISVSPMQYQSYNCNQLAAEIHRIQTRLGQLNVRLDEAASNDKSIAGVGAVLFWPALFALGGTKQQEQEYARLKGEYEATHQAAIHKQCPGMVASDHAIPTTTTLRPVNAKSKDIPNATSPK